MNIKRIVSLSWPFVIIIYIKLIKRKIEFSGLNKGAFIVNDFWKILLFFFSNRFVLKPSFLWTDFIEFLFTYINSLMCLWLCVRMLWLMKLKYKLIKTQKPLSSSLGYQIPSHDTNPIILSRFYSTIQIITKLYINI